MPVFTLRSELPVPPEEVFDWHARPGALHRLVPPWQNVEVLVREGGLDVGARTVFRLSLAGVPVTWEATHTWCERPEGFRDEQVRGPFSRWVHTHRFLPTDGGSVLEDEVDYAVPLGGMGDLVAGRSIARTVDDMFHYRHRRAAWDLGRHALCDRRLRVAITGASGLVGTALSAFLNAGGHTVLPMVRSRQQQGVYWSVKDGVVDTAALEGFDAVVHLAGASISKSWRGDYKQVIRASRVDGTTVLARALASMERPPATLISGSAVGFYGDRGDEELDESAGSGEGFLAEVGQAWEAATRPAEDAGLRVVHLRTGLVLSGNGGVLDTLLPIFRAGGGGSAGLWDPVVSVDSPRRSDRHHPPRPDPRRARPHQRRQPGHRAPEGLRPHPGPRVGAPGHRPRPRLRPAAVHGSRIRR